MEKYIRKLLEKQLRENPIQILYDPYGFTYTLRLIILFLLVIIILSINLQLYLLNKLDILSQTFSFIIIISITFFFYYKGAIISNVIFFVLEFLFYIYPLEINKDLFSTFIFNNSKFIIKYMIYFTLSFSLSYFFKIFDYQTKILSELHILDPILYLPSERYFYSYLNKQKLLFKNLNKYIILLEIENYYKIQTIYGNDFLEKYLNIIKQKITKYFTNTFELIFYCENGIFGFVYDSLNSIHNLEIYFQEQFDKILNTKFEIYNIPIYTQYNFIIINYPTHSDDPLKIIQKAKIFFLYIKEKKSKSIIYNESIEKTYLSNLELTNSLKIALDKNILQLYFQPIIDIKQNKIHSVETLLRWFHNKQSISPMVFIPIAEETELIHDITIYIINHLEEYIDFFINHNIGIQINLSSKDLYNSKVLKVLENFKTKNMYLEITENSLISDYNTIEKNINHLKKLGYRLCLDDFGTGFSSLMYLYQLSIDILKIDKLFIKDFTKSEYKKAIVKATTDICKNLNIHIIAEGIEDKETFRQLKNLNINLLQGYYFSKPLPFKKIKNYILKKEYLKQL